MVSVSVYQRLHLSLGFMGEPTGQAKSRAKKGEFMAPPLTLHSGGEWESVTMSCSMRSGLLLEHQERP